MSGCEITISVCVRCCAEHWMGWMSSHIVPTPILSQKFYSKTLGKWDSGRFRSFPKVTQLQNGRFEHICQLPKPILLTTLLPQTSPGLAHGNLYLGWQNLRHSSDASVFCVCLKSAWETSDQFAVGAESDDTGHACDVEIHFIHIAAEMTCGSCQLLLW